MTDNVDLWSDDQQISKFVKTSDIIEFKWELIHQNSSVCACLRQNGTNIELS